MAVTINLKGVANTPEYKAASRLKAGFERLGNSANGRIIIQSNAKLIGTKTKDIDIIVIGTFESKKRLKLKLFTAGIASDTKEEIEPVWVDVNISSFCFCIELKDHPPESVSLEGNKIYVNYSNRESDVSEQSENQKYALLNYIERECKYKPFVCNFIWLSQFDSESLSELLSPATVSAYSHNLLSGTPTIKNLFQLAMVQRPPIANKTGYYYSSSPNLTSEGEMDKIEEVLQKFEQVRKGIGKLTRRQVERVTTRILNDQQYAKEIGNKLVVFSGRAGTGKTVKLLRVAFDLASNSGKRCLILTFNHALVSDLRRTIHFADVPDGVDGQTITVMTLDSFFHSLLSSLNLIEKEKNYVQYRNNYIQELYEYVQVGALSQNDVDKSFLSRTNWDYLLIDEAQDWQNIERDILFELFGSNRLIIADGVDQMIRGTTGCSWTDSVPSRKTSEKRCLRQKHNLAVFVNAFAEKANVRWQLEPRDDLRGGKIIILETQYNNAFHSELYNACQESDNKAYEMMVLVPPSLVDSKQMNRLEFIDWFKNTEIKFWDGTRRDIRQEYSVDVDEHRLLQYDSARGLEGWTVVCVWLDDFIAHKASTYTDTPQAQLELGLASKEEKAREFAYKWALIPLTRPIDTLVITLKDVNSEVAHILKQLHEEYPDFIEWRKQ